MITVLNNNCLEALKEFPDNHFSSVVTDPPYGLSFMNKHWDYDVPGVDVWTEVLRCLKPGGYLLSFGGTRTYHRMVVNIEDAGFEIRDQLQWIYGSGFPKSLNVSKAIDDYFGAEREVVGKKDHPTAKNNDRTGDKSLFQNENHLNGSHDITTPSTPEAQQWDGWGTALKPANEPICVARKPLIGTVAENVLQHGTGGINIDGCRIGYKDEQDLNSATFGRGTNIIGGNYVGATHGDGRTNIPANPQGRWPANVMLDEEAAAMLDEQTGTLKSGIMKAGTIRAIEDTHTFGFRNPDEVENDTYGDSGGASRFFYCAKASRSERNKGLEDFELKQLNWSSGTKNPGSFQSEGTNRSVANNHPTVKPISVMRWLVKLITPLGGIVLDPFAGTCTTGIGCKLEGFDAVMIEREKEYADKGRARVEAWRREDEQLSLFV